MKKKASNKFILPTSTLIYLSIPLVFSLLGTKVSAQQIDYDGTDTLRNVTEYLIANFDCGEVNYLGQGSSAGEEAVCNNLQETVPMSRKLDSTLVCGSELCPAINPDNVSEVGGFLLGGNIIPLARNADSFEICSNLVESGDEVATWQETLRLIYGGKDGMGTNDEDSCLHNDRINLVLKWERLFDSPGCIDRPEICDELRHALRPGDNSFAAGLFKQLVGITGFCNGNADGFENEDKDPVRVNCKNNERYCPKDGAEYPGTLGLVLAVSVPSDEGKPEGWGEAVRNNKNCAIGKFDWRLHLAPFGSPCPYDLPGLGSTGLCLFPTDAEGNFGCNNRRHNRPSNASLAWDAREYNEQHRYADGRAILESMNEFHRVAVRCNEEDSAEQIGCIIGKHSCYVGFGSQNMLSANPDTIFPLAIQDASVELDSAYPLARRLFFNMRNGLNNASNPEENKLMACFTDPEKKNWLDEALIESGLEPVEILNFDAVCPILEESEI